MDWITWVQNEMRNDYEKENNIMNEDKIQIENTTAIEDARHADMVKVLVKSGAELKKGLTPQKLQMWLMGCDIIIKAGQLFDIIKKHTIYNKDLDRKQFYDAIDTLDTSVGDCGMVLEAVLHKSLPNPSDLELEILHMASCIPGEGAELLEMVLANIKASLPMDIENAKEELSDLEFYMEGCRARFNITRKQTLDKNYEKLSVRYKGMKYSDEAANKRADKQE